MQPSLDPLVTPLFVAGSLLIHHYLIHKSDSDCLHRFEMLYKYLAAQVLLWNVTK